MLKKLKGLVLLSTLLFLLVACSGKPEEKSDEKDKTGVAIEKVSEEIEENTLKVVKDKDFSRQVETGEGTFDLASEGGSTADGLIPVVFYDPETFPTAISIDVDGFDGSKLTFVYLDGVLLTKEQDSMTQAELHLQEVKSGITEGQHAVQLVQYEGDDESGEILTFKTQSYEIKYK